MMLAQALILHTVGRGAPGEAEAIGGKGEAGVAVQRPSAGGAKVEG